MLPLDSILVHKAFYNTVVWEKHMYAVHMASLSATTMMHSFHLTSNIQVVACVILVLLSLRQHILIEVYSPPSLSR